MNVVAIDQGLIDKRNISPILFYALGTIIGFTCLIFWIRIPYYMVLGLLGGLGLQMDFNGHYLALLPLLIYMLYVQSLYLQNGFV